MHVLSDTGICIRGFDDSLRGFDTTVHNCPGTGLSFPGRIDTYLLHRSESGVGQKNQGLKYAACYCYGSYCSDHLTL